MTSGAPDTNGLPAFQFGDSPQLADRLAALVISGRKTASCFAAVHADKVTQDGQRWIALSGNRTPLAIIEAVSTQRLRFSEVTPVMAVLEGEGDLSHRFWVDAHETYFRREGTWAPDMEINFETFRLAAILDPLFAEGATAHVRAEIAEAAARGYTGS